jgi:hypothetical protein
MGVGKINSYSHFLFKKLSHDVVRLSYVLEF